MLGVITTRSSRTYSIELVPFSVRSKVEHSKVNISYSKLMYRIVFEDLSKTLELC